MEPNRNRTCSVPVPSIPVLGNFGSVLGSRFILPSPNGGRGGAQAQALDHQGAADSLKKIRVRRSSSIEVTVRWRGQEQTAAGLWRSRLELREKEINRTDEELCTNLKY